MLRHAIVGVLLAGAGALACAAQPVSTATSTSTPDAARAGDAVRVGNAVQGQRIYEAKCSACHSVQDNRVGPKHAGVLGRRAGSVKGYEYSDALAQSRLVWSKQNLALWLTEPEDVIPGQKMGYRLSLPQERADVVQYLATLKVKK